jgi:quinol monooxygenase YgiN
MSQMMLMTEYLTRTGKREELFHLFESLLANTVATGRDFVAWSTSTTERDASYLVEYWSDAELFADFVNSPWYAAYVAAIDDLVKSPPSTTVGVPRLVEGI